jgi:4-oxalomesaconate tautomerase
MFIPHKVHKAIGVFGAVSVATACALPGSIASEFVPCRSDGSRSFEIEHPTGFFTVSMDIESGPSGPNVRRSALLRTARALMAGDVLVPGDVWRNGSL